MTAARVEAVAVALNEQDVRNSRNKKYPRHTDFSGMKLERADFRGATLVQCNFDNADCKYANFEGANCYGASFVHTNMHRANIANATFERSDFRPRDCFGMTMTLNCHTYNYMKVDHEIMKLWFFIPMSWDMPDIHGFKAPVTRWKEVASRLAKKYLGEDFEKNPEFQEAVVEATTEEGIGFWRAAITSILGAERIKKYQSIFECRQL